MSKHVACVNTHVPVVGLVGQRRFGQLVGQLVFCLNGPLDTKLSSRGAGSQQVTYYANLPNRVDIESW